MLIVKQKKKIFLTLINLFLFLIMINFFLFKNNKLMAMETIQKKYIPQESCSSVKLELNDYNKQTVSLNLSNPLFSLAGEQFLYQSLKNIDPIRLNQFLNINSLEELQNKYSEIQIDYSINLSFIQYLKNNLDLSLSNSSKDFEETFEETQKIKLSDLQNKKINNSIQQLNLPDTINYRRDRKIFNFMYDEQIKKNITSQITSRPYSIFEAKNLFIIFIDFLNIVEEKKRNRTI